jgi:hypothetical protein
VTPETPRPFGRGVVVPAVVILGRYGAATGEHRMPEANSQVTDPPRDGPRPSASRTPLISLVLMLVAVALAGVLVDRARRDGARPQGPVLFDGAFDRGLAAYGDGHTVHRERVKIVDDPLGLPRKVAKFTVYDGDIGPTDNPRAMLATPRELRNGEEFWIGWSTLFPTRGFPKSVPGWLTFEAVYGPPGDGTGPRHFQVEGSEILWRRNATYDYDVPWHMPLVRGRWIDFVIHQKQSRNARVGFVSLWVNTGSGWKRQRIDGERLFHTRTVDSTNGGGPNWHAVGLYRERGMFPVVTLYHASHRIGTSFRAVAPHSYR